MATTTTIQNICMGTRATATEIISPTHFNSINKLYGERHGKERLASVASFAFIVNSVYVWHRHTAHSRERSSVRRRRLCVVYDTKFK